MDWAVFSGFKAVEDHSVVAEAFFTLSKLSVRNEFCQQLLDCGGVALIFESLGNHVENQVRIFLFSCSIYIFKTLLSLISQ